MALLMVLLLLSFFFYYFATFNRKSVLVSPNLMSLTFFRDFIFLTYVPYIYYFSDARYLEHYVLSKLDGSIYFYYAALAALCFLVLFLITYNVMEKVFNKMARRIRAEINYTRIVTLISLLTFVFFVTIVLVSKKYNAGIFGLLSLDYQGVAETRHYLSQSGGLMKFNKIFMKSWVPMFSYLFLYIYLIRKVKFTWFKKSILLLSVINGLLASLFFLEKAIVFIYILGLLGVYVFSGRKLKKYYLPLLFILAVIFIGIMYLLTYGDRITDFEYLKNIVIHRTATQSVGSVMAFNYFEYFDFKGMSGVSNFWASVFDKTFSSPYSDIIKYYVPETSETSGSMSSFVTGEAYGLFGVYGIIFSGIIVAVWFSFFEATKHSNVLAIVFVGIYGIYFSHPVIASSFFSFVWPVGLMYNIFPIVIILVLSIKYKRRNSLVVNNEN